MFWSIAVGAAAFVAWCYCLARWPVPTKNVSVIGLIVLVLGSPLAVWILRSRQAAQDATGFNNLRQLGVGMQQAQQIRPEGLRTSPAPSDDAPPATP